MRPLKPLLWLLFVDNVKGHNKNSKQKLVYPNLLFARRPVFQWKSSSSYFYNFKILTELLATAFSEKIEGSSQSTSQELSEAHVSHKENIDMDDSSPYSEKWSDLMSYLNF